MSGGAAGWVTVGWVLVLGLLAAMPIGMVIGSLVPSTQKVGTWGMLPILVLAGISGIFFPIQQLWGWVQVVAQVFPMYWLGLGMRSAFLPDSAAALEISGSWRTLETVARPRRLGGGRAPGHAGRAAADGPPAVRLAGRGGPPGGGAVGQVTRVRVPECGRGDSNPHARRHGDLNAGCLPIPPLPLAIAS